MGPGMSVRETSFSQIRWGLLAKIFLGLGVAFVLLATWVDIYNNYLVHDP